MPVPKQKTLEQLQAIVDDFNSKKTIGDAVQVNTGTRNQPVWKDCTVRGKASILGGHSAVGWFNGVTGCYDLEFVQY